jgi:ArsR family transcriptional regulator
MYLCGGKGRREKDRLMSEGTSAGDPRSELRELRGYFKALSGVIRLQIVKQLAGTEELSVSELVVALRLSQPLVSWHLSGLRKAGLVKVRRDGRQVLCSLDRESLRQYQQSFAKLLGEDWILS